MKKLYFVPFLLFSVLAHSQKQTETKEQQAYLELMNEGDSFFDAGKIKESIAAFTKAIAKMPDAPDAYYGRGLVYFENSEFHNAIADFTKIIELGSDNTAGGYFMRGLSKMQIKEMETDSCTDLKKAKELQYPADWAMYRNICPDLK